MCLAVSREYRRVMDRQRDRRMDRQTSCHCIVRAMHARRTIKAYEKIAIFDQYLAVSPKRYHRRPCILFRRSSRVEQLVVTYASDCFDCPHIIHKCRSVMHQWRSCLSEMLMQKCNMLLLIMDSTWGLLTRAIHF